MEFFKVEWNAATQLRLHFLNIVIQRQCGKDPDKQKTNPGVKCKDKISLSR